MIFLFLFMIRSVGAATILVWGDSLSAGYGIDRDKAWPTLLGRRLAEQGYRYEVSNASVSGETSAGGLARLPEALQRLKPAIVILELGANDGLRGQPIVTLRSNLDTMIRLSREAGARVMLVGMRLPPNFGPIYVQKFHESFVDLARTRDVVLLPFLLDGFALQRNLFQEDGMHPVPEAQPLILDNIWPLLKPMLKR